MQQHIIHELPTIVNSENNQNQPNSLTQAQQRRGSKIADWLKAKVSKSGPRDSIPEEFICMCGYLEVNAMKKKRASWKKRFVVVRTDNSSVICFKKKEELRRQEELELSAAMTVASCSNEEDPFLIEILLRNTCVMTLKTYSAKYQEEWVSAIHKVLQAKKDSTMPGDRDEDVLDSSLEMSPSTAENSSVESFANLNLEPSLQQHEPLESPVPELSTFMLKGTKFQLDSKYDPIKVIGQGAYGVVISAKDTKAGQNVAIKKITNLFKDLEDAKRILREIRLLQHLKHPNIITIVDVLPSPYPTLLASKRSSSSNNGSNRSSVSDDTHESGFRLEDMYIVLELMETDLSKVIYSKVPLTPEHVRFFLYQILRGCKAMHAKGVLHRDIKPANLLVNAQCDLKVCDLAWLASSRARAGSSRTGSPPSRSMS